MHTQAIRHPRTGGSLPFSAWCVGVCASSVLSSTKGRTTMESVGCGCSCRDDRALEAIAVELTAVADRMRSAGLSHDLCHAALDAALTEEPAESGRAPGRRRRGRGAPAGARGHRGTGICAVAHAAGGRATPREEARSSSARIADAERLGEAA